MRRLKKYVIFLMSKRNMKKSIIYRFLFVVENSYLKKILNSYEFT